MALVKKGSFWYIVYDFDGKQIWKSTHTDNKDIAAAIQKTIQANNAENKLRRKVAEYLGDKPELIPPIIPTHKKRLKINAILPAVEKYRTISIDHRKAFSRFTDALPDAIKGQKFKRSKNELLIEAKAAAIERKKELIKKGYSPTKANGIIQLEFENMAKYKELFKDYGVVNWKKFLQESKNGKNR